MDITAPYTLLSIDPGSHALGYSLSKFSPATRSFTVMEYETLYPSKYDTSLKPHKKHYSDRLMTGIVISKLIECLVNKHRPDYLCSEDAFFNPTRPAAFISLLTVIYAVESTLYKMKLEEDIELYNEAKLYKIPPTVVKKIMSEDLGGKASKLDMLAALRQKVNSKQIAFMGVSQGTLPEEHTFTEHSTDAICVGYAFTKLWWEILKQDLVEPHMTAFSKSTVNLLQKKKFHSPYVNIKSR